MRLLINILHTSNINDIVNERQIKISIAIAAASQLKEVSVIAISIKL